MYRKRKLRVVSQVYVPKSLTVILLARLLILLLLLKACCLAALLGGPSKVVNFPIHKMFQMLWILLLGPFVRSSTLSRELVRIWSHQLTNRELRLLFQRLSPTGNDIVNEISMTPVVEWCSENRFFLLTDTFSDEIVPNYPSYPVLIRGPKWASIDWSSRSRLMNLMQVWFRMMLNLACKLKDRLWLMLVM